MSLTDLPPIEVAVKMKKEEFHKIVKEFLKHSSYCGSVFLPTKMSDWCRYLQCDGIQCNSDLVAQLTRKTPTVPMMISQNCRPNTTVGSILLNGTDKGCFDDYLCLSSSLSKDYHYMIGLFGVVTVLLCIIFTLVYIKGFFKEYRNTIASMIIGQAVCDLLYLVLLAAGFLSIFFYYSSLTDQIEFYTTFHVYIIPYVIPCAQLFEALSAWILAILSFDRFNHLQHGKHYKHILTKKVFIIILSILFLLLIGFMILNIFTYKLIPIQTNQLSANHYRLVYTKLGQLKSFSKMINFNLKMPLHYLLPYFIIFIFLTMIIHKMIFSGGLDPSRLLNYETFQEFRLTRSIVLTSSLLLITKLPTMALHIMVHESGIVFAARIKLQLICHCLNMIYYIIKCFAIHPYMCPIYSSWLQKKICMETKIEEDEFLRQRLYSLDNNYDCKQYLLNKDVTTVKLNVDRETDV